MKLVLENLREPKEFRVEIGETAVDVFHFSVFDRDTWETDSMSTSIRRSDYDRGLLELQAIGSCRIPGKHADLALAVKQGGTLSVSMLGQHKSVHLQGLSFRLEDDAA